MAQSYEGSIAQGTREAQLGYQHVTPQQPGEAYSSFATRESAFNHNRK
ncbi:MAG TPA: hypothetical protein VI386_05440 [Candidatus Sulfotelmatobacter sp.]